MTTIPLADARARLSQIVEEAVRTHERVEITRNGTRAAVLMSIDDYDVLMETLDILSDADLVRELNDAVAEASRGETHSFDDVLAEMQVQGRAPSDL